MSWWKVKNRKMSQKHKKNGRLLKVMGEPTHILKATSQNKSYSFVASKIQSERTSTFRRMIDSGHSILGKNSLTK